MSWTIRAAERGLRESLEESFGPDLQGVVVYGHRWDPGTRKDLLRVVVDGATTPERKIKRLPRQIGGFDVKVSRAGSVEM
jgi:hypothetical protein